MSASFEMCQKFETEVIILKLNYTKRDLNFWQIIVH